MERTTLVISRMLLLLCGVSLACCGGAMTRSKAPLRPEQAQLFENGIDWITAPAALQGQWKQEWYSELDRRVQYADLIVLCKIRTLRTDTDHDQRVVHRITVRMVDVFQGEPGSDNLDLAVSDHHAGFSSVDQSKDRILDRHFVAFVRWATDEGGHLGPHFHLMAASPEIVTEVKERVAYVQAHFGDDSRN